MRQSRTIAAQAMTGLMRERTVMLVAVMFVALVFVSAYLGWAATTTVNAIYADASAYLASVGQPVPPNPVTEGSPLAILRNLSVYVSLIGAFAAVLTGTRLIEADRTAGTLPLMAARPLERVTYARGKVEALGRATAAIILVAAIVSALTLVVMPQVRVGAADWVHFVGFFALSWAYVMVFGLVALGAAARFSAPAAGLLGATVVWLAVTFVLPAITGNVTPTAAINPVSALAAAPDTAAFQLLGDLFGPLSLSESYKFISADLLGYLPDGIQPRGLIPPLVDLLLALGISGGIALAGCLALDPNQGGPDA